MVTRASIAKQLLPGLSAVVGTNYKMVVGEHSVLFDMDTSNRSFEEEQMMSDLGLAVVKPEGGGVSYDDMQETYTSRYIHDTVGLAFAVTEEAMEDNLYDTKAKMKAAALGRALAVTKETRAANVYNLAFSNAQIGGDGVPLCSASHPTLSGNQSNTVAADMSETALENACIAVALFRNERGILIGAMARSLHIPPQLKFTANKILRSELTTTLGGSGTAPRNDLNVLRSDGYFPGGIHVNHRFTDQDAWFIRTDVPNGTKIYTRRKLRFGEEGDFETGNLRYKATERYSLGWTDWRNVYGSTGA